MGINVRITNSLARVFKTSNDFFKVMRSSNKDKVLSQVRNIGEKSKQEINDKMAIIITYHDQKASEVENYLELYQELERLKDVLYKTQKEIELIENKLKGKGR